MGASTRGEPQPAEEHTGTPHQSRRPYLPGLRVCVCFHLRDFFAGFGPLIGVDSIKCFA